MPCRLQRAPRGLGLAEQADHRAAVAAGAGELRPQRAQPRAAGAPSRPARGEDSPSAASSPWFMFISVAQRLEVARLDRLRRPPRASRPISSNSRA